MSEPNDRIVPEGLGASSRQGLVLHAALGFGAVSETFLVDRMIELERLGWEAWVATRFLVPDPSFEFPPPERVLVPRPLSRRLPQRLRRNEWWWLREPIETLRPALIHAHFGWTAAVAIGAAERYGIPLVGGFHGYDATVYPHHGFGAHDQPSAPSFRPDDVFGELFERASHLLATSEFIASKLRGLGCDAPIEVVPSGIRLDGFPFRGPRSSQDGYRLLFVGRLVPYKGLDLTIRALATLGGTGTEAPTLSVIGEGPVREECEALARSLGVADRVRFFGAGSRSDVLAALQAADVLVLPSRTTDAGQAEGLGNVVKEALAVGLEVAISDNGGLPEVMPPDRSGELVPEGDATALAERLEAIREIRPRWPERAHEGRVWVEEAFDWRKLAPAIDAVYRRVVSVTVSEGPQRGSS